MREGIASDVIKKLNARKRQFARSLIDWGKDHSARYPWRDTSDPYCVSIAEMLLRKTRSEAVSKVYLQFITEFTSFDDLSAASVNKIAKVIHSLGLHSRAKHFKKVARRISQDHNGRVPLRRQDLFSVIGPASQYTVNAIECFALGRKLPLFDVNVARVLSRVFSIDFGADPHKKSMSWEIASALLPDRMVKEYNWALLDLGRTVCVKKPKCVECPLFSICDYARSVNQGGQIPEASQKSLLQ